jgi:hypothetical protein
MGIVFLCRGGGPPGVAWRDSLACPSLRGPILSARAERIGRKARQREGLFTKPPFPLESHPPKFVIDARLTHYRARARPPAVPRNRTGSGMSVYVLSGASVGNGLDRSGGFLAGIVFLCRGGGPPGVAWRRSEACPSLRGPILSVRAERIGRKARQREGLCTKPPFPLESHPPKFAIDARLHALPCAFPASGRVRVRRRIRRERS